MEAQLIRSLNAYNAPGTSVNPQSMPRSMPKPRFAGSKNGMLAAGSFVQEVDSGWSTFDSASWGYALNPMSRNASPTSGIYLMADDPVFINHNEERYGSVEILTVGQMNEILGQCEDLATSIAQAPTDRLNAQQQGIREFMDLAAKLGDARGDLYRRLAARGALNDATSATSTYRDGRTGEPKEVQKTKPFLSAEDLAEAKRLHNKTHEMGLRGLSEAGILESYGFGGVVVSTSDARRTTPHQTLGYARAPLIGVKCAGDSYVFNIWSAGVRTGDHLYIVLRRRRNGDGSYGQYQMEPVVAGPEGPRLDQLVYRDRSGALRYGHAFYVGLVIGIESRGSQYEDSRRIAAGLTAATAKQQREAVTDVGRLRVQIGM